MLLLWVNNTLLKPVGTKSFNYIHVATIFKSFGICLFNKHCLGAQDMLGSVKDAASASRLHRGMKNRQTIWCRGSTQIKPGPVPTYPLSTQGRHPGGSDCLSWRRKRRQLGRQKGTAFQTQGMRMQRYGSHREPGRFWEAELINTGERSITSLE